LALSTGLGRAVLLAIVESWGASSAQVVNLEWLEALPHDQNGQRISPDVGWLTWLAPPDSLLVHPPAAAKAERSPGGALLMTLMDEPVGPTNSVHLARMRALNDALRPVQMLWSHV
jgi:hypothetical protein